MKMRRKNTWRSTVVAAVCGLAGCAATPESAPPPAVASAPPSPSLVMPTATLRGLTMRDDSTATGWISTRNDHLLGYPADPRTIVFDLAEVEGHERLRITDGKPRESSRYTTRTLRVLRR